MLNFFKRLFRKDFNQSESLDTRVIRFTREFVDMSKDKYCDLEVLHVAKMYKFVTHEQLMQDYITNFDHEFYI